MTESLDEIAELFARDSRRLTQRLGLRAPGLDIDLGLENARLGDWLRRSMAPCFTDKEGEITAAPAEQSAQYRVSLVHGDHLIRAAAEHIARAGIPPNLRISTARKGWRITDDAGRALIYEPREGTACLIAPNGAVLEAAYGSRSRWPGKVLCDLVAELLHRHLEGAGWFCHHAGAVELDGRVLAVIGDGGSGKTSLIAGLMAAGARLIANERCFFRADGAGVTSYAFAQMIFVGLGTALQFPGLDRHLPEPGALSGLQRRMSRSRLKRTPRADWPGLDDKLGLLPVEFAECLGAPPPRAGGKVAGIVMPEIDLGARDISLRPLSPSETRALVTRNLLGRGRDRHRPFWLDLGQGLAEPAIDAISALPAHALRFSTGGGGLRGAADPGAEIARAFGWG